MLKGRSCGVYALSLSHTFLYSRESQMFHVELGCLDTRPALFREHTEIDGSVSTHVLVGWTEGGLPQYRSTLGTNRCDLARSENPHRILGKKGCIIF